jgi:hypothetical protein
MGEITLSDKQRGWLQHVEACTAAGGSMKVYAERHGLLHDRRELAAQLG